MSRRRRKSNDDMIAYLIAFIGIAFILAFIAEYIIPILITCGIVGAVIGIIAIIKHHKSAKSNNTQTTANNQQSQDSDKQESEAEKQSNVNWEIKYKFASDLEAINVNYQKKPLLTDHERNFYYTLAPIAKKYDLCVLSKIRIADLVEPTAHAYKERSEYFHYFGKIKAKHIDFALCDPKDLSVKLLIELDDWTHGTTKGKERDEFVESVYADTGYRLLRVYDPWSLEKKIREALGITEEYKIKTP